MIYVYDSDHELAFGVYGCNRCHKNYTVNDGTWRQCTPDLCHDCVEYLGKQFALVRDPESLH